MKKYVMTVCMAVVLSMIAGTVLYGSDAKAGSLICVGLYSETDAGYVSYRVGSGSWIVVKVGDSIPPNAEIKINVDRDWIELVPWNNPNGVYEITGIADKEVVKKVSYILKEKPRIVSFPKKGTQVDPKFKDKLVVTQYLGRQKYRADKTSKAMDIKYGDVLDIKGTVQIIAINNTLTIAYPNGALATVVGPLKFDVAKMFTKENLYKYLNVAK
jgi:hypothetical protein